MRSQILVAMSCGLLVAACHGPSTRTALRATEDTPVRSTTAEYPGSHLDARGYRVDENSFRNWSETRQAQAAPVSSAPASGAPVSIVTPPRTGGNGPVAWTSNGYSYDQWGNLISGPGQPAPRRAAR